MRRIADGWIVTSASYASASPAGSTLPSVARHPHLRPEHRLRRGGAQQHDQLRLHRVELRLPPARARPHLLAVGLLVEAHLARCPAST